MRRSSPAWAACALEALDDVVVLTDAEGTIEWANPAFSRLVGAHADAIVGSRFEDFVAGEDLVHLVGFASVLGLQGGSHNVLLNGTDGATQALVSTALFEDDGSARVVLVGRPTVDLQEEAAAQSRIAADEREKADALEVAHRELEAMHRELVETQATLMRASRLAGMAEVATNVLHEVGNSLNSVGVGAEMLARHVDTSVVVKLRKTMAVLDEELGADRSPRLNKALQLLDLLIARADSQLTAAGEELRRIGANVEHVKTIVAAQQQHAKTTDVAELVSLAELVNEVVMQQDLHTVELTVDIDAGTCTVLRHRFALIVTDLLSNARDAVAGRERSAIAIHGRVREDLVVVEVHDSGSGVPPELRERIFQHGFDLHAGANAAQQLGGSLTVSESQDLGGAMFVLEFPRDKRNGPFRGRTTASLSTYGVDGVSHGEHPT